MHLKLPGPSFHRILVNSVEKYPIWLICAKQLFTFYKVWIIKKRRKMLAFNFKINQNL